MSSRDTMVHLDGERVREARAEKDLSQEQVVERVGKLVAKNGTVPPVSGQSGESAEQVPDYGEVSLATYKQIEAGRRPDKRPTVINLNKAQAIAHVLGKSLESLMADQPPGSGADASPDRIMLDLPSEVGLRAEVAVTADRVTGGHLTVLVNPSDNAETVDEWWVQQPASRHGEEFRCTCQFGEGRLGLGERFTVVAVVTDRPFRTGERLYGIPDGPEIARRVVRRTR